MKTPRRLSRSAVVSIASLSLLVTLGAASGTGCSRLTGGPTPKTEDDKTLYALGQMLGHSIAVFDLSPGELEMVKAGLSDAVLKKKPAVEGDAYRAKVDALARSRSTSMAQKEKARGPALIAAAAKEPGAVKLPSGMVIRTVKPGTGESPAPTDQVKVHYEGRLPDGTVFDSSRKRGQPATFPLNGVIKCWTEGVTHMKVGEQAILTCPADLAYGDRGQQNIPGGSTLTFDVELLGIVKPQ